MKTHDSAVLSRSPGYDITIDDRLLSDGTKHVIHFEEIEADRAYEKI
jgi:hypothetical protein